MLIRNLLYILQLQGYELRKFIKFAYTHPKWWQLQKRNKLDWTLKAKAICAVATFLSALIWLVGISTFGLYGLAFIFLTLAILPLSISLAAFLLSPVDIYLKNKLVFQAKSLLKQNRENLVVIGITGSYGKTSTKEILAAVLEEKFKVIKTGQNINTGLGVAQFIKDNISLLKSAEIFIVEMGAYKKGEIRRICEIVAPDYGILTGINESHLERFGSLENTIRAKFELTTAAKKLVVLNFDDQNIKDNYERFKTDAFVGMTQKGIDIDVLDDFQGLEFIYENQKYKTKLLAKHNVSLILMAIQLAKEMGMETAEIAKRVETIDYVPHRLQPIYNSQTNVWVIDDSYNGNYDGIVSGLEVLSRAKGRKLVLTPGLVELGSQEKEVHHKIGNLYAKQDVDRVLLVSSQAAQYIIEGLESKGYNRYTLYPSTKAAHDDLANVVQSGDTIIFQNDLPDSYF